MFIPVILGLLYLLVLWLVGSLCYSRGRTRGKGDERNSRELLDFLRLMEEFDANLPGEIEYEAPARK